MDINRAAPAIASGEALLDADPEKVPAFPRRNETRRERTHV
jgi:hypothetical protein